MQTTIREPFLPNLESDRWPNTPAPAMMYLTQGNAISSAHIFNIKHQFDIIVWTDNWVPKLKLISPVIYPYTYFRKVARKQVLAENLSQIIWI